MQQGAAYLDPQDTIVALASAPGPGGRAILRLSGPSSLALANTLFSAEQLPSGRERAWHTGVVHLPGVAALVPADLYVWPAPHTYTGQDLAELHTLSCPPLVDLMIAQLLNAGARAAQPGEFTLRAFLAGKLDLTRAEAVLGVIEAGSREELRHALKQLAGGVSQPLLELREDLLNLLADVEAGLDFADEDLHFVDQAALLTRLSKGLALVTLARKQLETRAVTTRPFRVVLAGRPNAGKSSLFNALAGRDAALVSNVPGTTSDYLVHRLDLGGVPVELVDTAGWQSAQNALQTQAQDLGRQQTEDADLILLCVEAGGPPDTRENAWLGQRSSRAVGVATKCDLAAASPTLLPTSAVTKSGLSELRDFVAERARAHARPALAPSLGRCRHHVDACLAHLRRGHEMVLFEEAPELLAVELRGALDELGAMVGAVYTDDLLDRIFSRFCIGK
jgi:tRNA modification GTPase